MSDLDKFIQENQKFIKIKTGETFEGIYRGCKQHQDKFNPEKTTISYMFEMPITGKIIPWTNGSMKTAVKMKKFTEGDYLHVERIGDGAKTTEYLITKIENVKIPIPVLKTAVEPDETPF